MNPEQTTQQTDRHALHFFFCAAFYMNSRPLHFLHTFAPPSHQQRPPLSKKHGNLPYPIPVAIPGLNPAHTPHRYVDHLLNMCIALPPSLCIYPISTFFFFLFKFHGNSVEMEAVGAVVWGNSAQ